MAGWIRFFIVAAVPCTNLMGNFQAVVKVVGQSTIFDRYYASDASMGQLKFDIIQTLELPSRSALELRFLNNGNQAADNGALNDVAGLVGCLKLNNEE